MASYKYMLSADDVANELGCSKSRFKITCIQARKVHEQGISFSRLYYSCGTYSEGLLGKKDVWL